MMRDQMATSEHDLVAGEVISMPLLLIALFFVFRGWRPALLPLGAAVATVTGALLALLAATRFVDVAGYAVDVAVLFGLALAVDYSLLMVSRFREQRASGRSVEDAVAGSVATSGRTIVFSALTVTVALAGLFLFGNPTFTSLAIGGIATVLVALAAGLTLTPALTAILGIEDRRSVRPGRGIHGVFWHLARLVQRRPAVTAVLHLGAASGDGTTVPRRPFQQRGLPGAADVGGESPRHRHHGEGVPCDVDGARRGRDPSPACASRAGAVPALPAQRSGRPGCDQPGHGSLANRPGRGSSRKGRPGPGCSTRGRGGALTSAALRGACHRVGSIAGRLRASGDHPPPVRGGVDRPDDDGPVVPDDRLRAGPDQGRGDERSVAGCHLRGPDLGLPRRAPLRPAPFPGHRHDRSVGSDPGVRVRVRAVHGLRGVLVVAHQGVLRRLRGQ